MGMCLRVHAPDLPAAQVRALDRPMQFADRFDALQQFEFKRSGTPVRSFQPGGGHAFRTGQLEEVIVLHEHARLLARLSPADCDHDVLTERFDWYARSDLEHALLTGLATCVPLWIGDERSDVLCYQPVIGEMTADDLANLPVGLAVMCLMWGTSDEDNIRDMVTRRGGPQVPGFKRSGPVDERLLKQACARQLRAAQNRDQRFVWRNLHKVARFAVQETNNPFLDATYDNPRMLEHLPNALTMRTVRHVVKLAGHARTWYEAVMHACTLLDQLPGLWPQVFDVWGLACGSPKAAA